MLFGVGEEFSTGLHQRALFSDAGQNVLQETALRFVIVHVVTGQHRHAPRPRQRVHVGQMSLVVRPAVYAGGQVQPVFENLPIDVVRGTPLPDRRIMHRRDETVRPLGDVGECDRTRSLDGADAALGDDAREPAVARPIRAIQRDRRRVDRRKLGADDQFDTE